MSTLRNCIPENLTEYQRDFMVMDQMLIWSKIGWYIAAKVLLEFLKDSRNLQIGMDREMNFYWRRNMYGLWTSEVFGMPWKEESDILANLFIFIKNSINFQNNNSFS